jgi:3,4-dihydroxy 2-butanone 4-phosphate synthase / GTP cyclohydrolase II
MLDGIGNMDTIENAIEDIREGKFVIVVDDENRENEGDLVIVAAKVGPEAVNFMAKEGRGLICLAATGTRMRELNIEPMVKKNTDKKGTAFTVSIDAKDGTTTGISAHDRAVTVRKFLDPNAKPGDFCRPGHIFPLRAREGGVLTRAGHTEASVDLARLAGLAPAGLICEIMNDDGTMARLPQLEIFAKKHNLRIVSIEDLIKYRLKHDKTYIGAEKEPLVERIGEAELPSRYGNFKIIAYKSHADGMEHVALVKGEVQGKENVLVRVHSECLTGDILGSLRCDCGGQLAEALRRIEEEECGVLLYMRQEGRGIGLGEKIKAYALQDKGMDTVEANHALGYEDDLRDYGAGAQILRDLGLASIRLMTNNPRKIIGLGGYGLRAVRREPICLPSNKHNEKYLETKKKKMGHLNR